MQGLLTIPEAAQKASRPESHIRRALKDGRLAGHKFGTAYAIKEEDLAAYLDQKPTAAEVQPPVIVGAPPSTRIQPQPVPAQAPVRVDLSSLPSLQSTKRRS